MYYDIYLLPVIQTIMYILFTEDVAGMPLTQIHFYLLVMSPCEQLVTQALDNPLVKCMIKGLNDAGCSFDVVRNVVCEPINGGLAGG